MERNLLTGARMDRMVDAPTAADEAKVLQEIGYGDFSPDSQASLGQALAQERDKTFQELYQFVPDQSVVDVFRVKYDYHNIKTLLKARATGQDPSPLLVEAGRVEVRRLREAVEEGKLDLDAPLSDYWGAGVGNPYSEGHPSARNLMTHTSSVKDLSTTRGLSKLRGLLQSSSSWRSMEPGDGGYWYYSNFGFCVLGTTLELAADRLLDDYLQERFLQPMGIRATFYSGNMEEDEVATLYTTGGIGRSAAEHAGQTVPTKIGMGASYYPGGFTVSAVDMAKLVSVLINDGTYQGTQYLTPESVAAMETPQFTVDPGETSPFEQCLVLRRQENVLGQDVLYYHTGSAYGVFSLMTYNPETGNGVVVITTGTARKTDEHGLYALCADLSENLYARMEQSA